MGKKRNSYRLLVGKPEGKKPLGRPRRKWVDNIGMDLGEVGWGDVDWIDRLLSSLDHYSTLKMEVVYLPETSVKFYQAV
jgi:hypothetical protein